MEHTDHSIAITVDRVPKAFSPTQLITISAIGVHNLSSCGNELGKRLWRHLASIAFNAHYVRDAAYVDILHVSRTKVKIKMFNEVARE